MSYRFSLTLMLWYALAAFFYQHFTVPKADNVLWWYGGLTTLVLASVIHGIGAYLQRPVCVGCQKTILMAWWFGSYRHPLTGRLRHYACPPENCKEPS